MENKNISVYIKIDKDNNIVDIGSDVFITDTTDWIKIDECEGDKYAHAQGQYFDTLLTDEVGKHRYKYKNNVVVEE